MANTTVKGVGAVAKGGGRDDGGVCKGFRDPLGVAKGREAKNGKGDELEFCGEMIEVLFFVFIDVGKKSALRGGDAFDGKEIMWARRVC